MGILCSPYWIVCLVANLSWDEEVMAKMASLHAEGMTDKELQEQWEQADLDGWPEEPHPPEGFRDKANGE